MSQHERCWPQTLRLALIAAIPPLAALAIFAIILAPDSDGYITYARQIVAGQAPSGLTLLLESQSPVSLLRMPGYPAFLAVLMLVFPNGWQLAAILLQIAAQAALAAGVYMGARRMMIGLLVSMASFSG